MNIMVTGGAGYIGSHVVLQLIEAGHDVVVVDNLSTGNRQAAGGARLAEGDIGDAAFLDEVFKSATFDAVMHFAASISVEESVSDPLGYYRNNTANSITLFEAMKRAGVKDIIFSSTAAVYGEPETIPVDESAPLKPGSPYGTSKLLVEAVLADMAKAGQARPVCLRYFNVAGADPEGRLGQKSAKATHLLARIMLAAAGETDGFTIYGTDYDTPDGTCVRDYIHVTDLADAHVRALSHLADGKGAATFNLGYGHGYSVRQMVEAAKRVIGKDFPVKEGARRPGDIAQVVADSTRARRELGWKPRHDDVADIIATAWNWMRSPRF